MHNLFPSHPSNPARLSMTSNRSGSGFESSVSDLPPPTGAAAVHAASPLHCSSQHADQEVETLQGMRGLRATEVEPHNDYSAV